MTDDPNAEAPAVARAVLAVSVWEQAADLPADLREQLALPGIAEAVDLIRRTTLLSGPAKLELLARVVRKGDESPDVQSNVGTLALSLTRLDRDAETRTAARDWLLDHLAHSVPGEEPLHRVDADLLHPGGYLIDLVEDVQTFALTIKIPDCQTVVVQVGTTPALSISTELRTPQPLADFVHIIDPREWPKCPVQHAVFESMTPITPLSALPPPDTRVLPGIPCWGATLQEVVNLIGLIRLTSDLDFKYFANNSRIGCTYDLRRSVDGRESVNQGYLLAEDLGVPDIRVVRTLKQIHFTFGDLPPSLVCPVWGPAIAVIAWACMPKH